MGVAWSYDIVGMRAVEREIRFKTKEWVYGGEGKNDEEETRPGEKKGSEGMCK